MKMLRTTLPPLCAAVLGYALGSITDARRPSPPPTASMSPQRGSGTGSTTHATRADALAAALSALMDRDDFRQLARLGALLERLDASQMRELFDTLNRLPEPERDVLLPRLLAYWMKRDPQAATEWMQPRLAACAKDKWFSASFVTGDTQLAKAWAENAPQLAVEFARQHAGTELAGVLLWNAIFSWPDRSDEARFAVLLAFPPGKKRENVMMSFFSSWGRSNLAGQLAAVSALPPGRERDGALTEALRQMAWKEPAAALSRAESDGLTDPTLLTFVVSGAAKSNPSVAAQWLEQHDDVLATAGGVVVLQWAAQDPAAAFAWAAKHGISLTDNPVRPALSDGFGWRFTYELTGENPLTSALRNQPDAALAWLRALPAGADRDRYLEHAILRAADPAIVQPLVAQLPPEAAARAAAWMALGATRSEPLPLPPGADRDAMLCGMATAQATREPEKALNRVLEIRDLALRRRTLGDVFWELNHGPTDLGNGVSTGGASEAARSAARAWLERARIPVEWKREWVGK